MHDERCLRVLLVEDDEDDYLLTTDLLAGLEHLRCHVDWAHSYDQAKSLLATGDYHIMLLDTQLGEHCGLEVLREAAELGFNGPTLMLSGQADQDTDAAARNAGAVDYLLKGRLDGYLLERSLRYALERKKLLDELQSRSHKLYEREMQLRDIMEQSVAGVIVVNHEGTVLFANPMAEVFFARSKHELLGERLDIPMQPNDQHEIDIYLEDGQQGVAELRIVDVQWQGSSASLATLLDITRRKQAEESLAYHAKYDALTGLANRSLFQEFLAHALPRANRNKHLVALLFLDLDHFKQINDRLGHDAGDRLIHGVAQRLQKCLRGGDLIARLGGDEFAVVVDSINDVQHAGRVAEKILSGLQDPFTICGNQILTRTSIGIAAFPEDALDTDGLVKAADTAMYEAKRLGRNNYQYFAAEMQEAAVMRSILEYDLDYALRNQQFELYFQPQLDAHARTICGAEALIRWHHDRRGLLAPEEFIEVAEESGLIVPIGKWVVMAACEQMRQWRTAGLSGPFSLSINLSMRELKRDNIVERIVNALATSGIDPGDLQIELTETTVMEDPQSAIVQLQQLHDIGVKIVIDDFGTGYSSLQYLNRLPLDCLKIDRSFVEKIDAYRDAQIIVRTTINLAHNLGLEVVAEGVETQAQAAYLVSHGCEKLQGYLIGEPQCADRFEKLLQFEPSQPRHQLNEIGIA
ncbi:MAG: EAL domain-containing protein [Gammaproteobacteria bacterium]|nr:EAL domain-containing protein [Gammaproteobacteria bacterium]